MSGRGNVGSMKQPNQPYQFKENANFCNSKEANLHSEFWSNQLIKGASIQRFGIEKVELSQNS